MDEDELVENLIAKLLAAHETIGGQAEVIRQLNEEIASHHEMQNQNTPRAHIRPIPSKELEDAITTAITPRRG